MPTSMLTVQDLYNACRTFKQMGKTDIRLNARGKPEPLRDSRGRIKKGKDGKPVMIRKGLKIWSWRVKEGEDEEGDIYKVVTCKARDQGPTHTLEMIFYGVGNEANVALDCSCEYYRYWCEVALQKKGSARLEDPIEMKIWSNGGPYKYTNLDEEPIICKHLYAALLAGAANKKARGISLEDQRKLAEKEKKKKELEVKREKAKEKIEKSKEKTREKPKLKKEGKEIPKKSTIKKPPETKKPPEPKRYATPPATKWTKKSK